MSRKVKVEKTKSTKFGPFAMVEAKLKVESTTGKMVEMQRVVFERGDAVAMLVHRRDKDTVILTRQFRFPARFNKAEDSEGWIVELPAGIVEDGEKPEVSARREVEEEVGYRVDKLEEIATFFVSPGGTSERVSLYYAAVTGPPVSDGGGVESEQEDIEVLEVPRKDFIALVKDNSIRDAKTLLAGYWLAARKD